MFWRPMKIKIILAVCQCVSSSSFKISNRKFKYGIMNVYHIKDTTPHFSPLHIGNNGIRDYSSRRSLSEFSSYVWDFHQSCSIHLTNIICKWNFNNIHTCTMNNLLNLLFVQTIFNIKTEFNKIKDLWSEYKNLVFSC